MNFQVIEINDPLWDQKVKSCKTYDFHHTSCFHKIELKEKEKAVLLSLSEDDGFMCFPLIIRPIEGNTFYDATSVYGYCGPIATRDIVNFSESFTTYFQSQFIKFCKEQNIISVFSRLHPLIGQKELFYNFGSVLSLNKTVAIDLSLPIDIQRQGYSRSYKNQINKLSKRLGYYVKTASLDEFEIFKEIYFETMDRVNAEEYYYFSDEYLIALMDNSCFDTRTLIAYNNENIPVAACIYTITQNIMQYHLGGTKDIALQDAPIRLIMDEARLMANELNLNYFHLGGGLGGSDEDSLFRFKAGFSKNYHSFKIWKMILDSEKYSLLVKDRGLENSESNFFPLYRLSIE